MPYAHKEQDQREGGATTISQGQSFVEIGGKKWAVENDPDTAGGGELIPSKTYITISGKAIIVDKDEAKPDRITLFPRAKSPTGFVEVA